MADSRSTVDDDGKPVAPVVPGGDPELVGTGPQGRVPSKDGDVDPEETPEENSDSGERHDHQDTREVS